MSRSHHKCYNVCVIGIRHVFITIDLMSNMFSVSTKTKKMERKKLKFLRSFSRGFTCKHQQYIDWMENMLSLSIFCLFVRFIHFLHVNFFVPLSLLPLLLLSVRTIVPFAWIHSINCSHIFRISLIQSNSLCNMFNGFVFNLCLHFLCVL